MGTLGLDPFSSSSDPKQSNSNSAATAAAVAVAPDLRQNIATESRDFKRPGLAFALSLLLPGLGQLYCRKTRGWITLAFFALSIGLGVAGWPENETLLGLGIIGGIALYAFGFLDAYYTAREINRGVDNLLDGNHARVALVLNLLTNGFGYFYLGERGKGIAIFIVMKVLAGIAKTAKTSTGSSLWTLAIVVFTVAYALDAWRIGRKKEEELLRGSDGRSLELPVERKEFGPMIPVTLAVLMIVNVVALMGIGAVVPDYSKIDQSKASVDKQADDTWVYNNSHYGVALAAPAGWEIEYKQGSDVFAQATHAESGCNVILMPVVGFPASVDSELEVLLKSHPAANVAGIKQTTLGGHAANENKYTLTTKNGVNVDQSYISYRTGLTSYYLIVSQATFDEECGPDITWIRDHIKLP